jgi:CxxC motif-containing protein (DUF1111 family)
MYGASLYTQYLPLVNPADLSLLTKGYTDQYWHNILMSNHMNQTPDHFIRGIRGRTLWHNEFRSQLGYNAGEGIVTKNDLPVNNAVTQALKQVDFPAGFQVLDHKAPFHANTCDSCHVRNGSGIPLKPNRELPKIHSDRTMNSGFNINNDYTYANRTPKNPGNKSTRSEIPAMKIVLFDLGEKAEAEHLEQCDVNDHGTPKGSFPTLEPHYYTNPIMNFYSNTLHVNQEKLDPNMNFLTRPTYGLTYQPVADGKGYELVDTTIRKNRVDPNKPYTPWYVEISNPIFEESCDDTKAFNANPGVNEAAWPTSCTTVKGPAIMAAINDRPPSPSATTTTTVVGHMHLLGRRLGNTPLLEMIPDQTIKQIQADQKKTFTHNGCYGLAAGTRGGGATHYRTCENGVEGADGKDCYISRFGWIGDRASLEDQIANAASVEMNITSKESYKTINPNPKNASELVRYKDRLCGPADKICTGDKGANLNTANSDITEQEIKDMATYQRWIGIPNRSEYQVSSQMVQAGEAVFRDKLQCHSCHVIDKIVFVKDDNMLPDEERERLASLTKGQSDYPFISYLGTDLLLHDMGYSSQVAKAPDGMQIRNADGTVKEAFKAWVQKIRTPALKGLRFNRFVTDSIHNTKGTPFGKNPPPSNAMAACDFLMHDGRACDAIEAAYLHDGPAIKQLDMIKKLNELSDDELKALRAFLYSL